MKSRLFLFMATLFVMQNVCGEDKFGQQKARWLQIAQENMPTLQKRVVEPLRVVEAVKDEKVFQGWTYKTSSFRLEDFYKTNFSSLRSITLDFGEHLTGYCTIRLKTTDRTWDAPTRLKMTFGEVPAEMNTPFDPFPGSLSRGWMQDETVEFMEVDMDREITLPRRLSMRYLKIELLGTSSGYNFAIDKLYFTAQSSAGEVQTSLLPTCPKMFRDINEVALSTLRECMQTVFEDGPKRDHRLWIGDLYLQYLANRYSFRNYQLTKRCLYLFAGLATEKGILICNLFELPKPHAQPSTYLVPYHLLYIATLLEYYRDSHDKETALDLWPLCKVQMEDALSFVENDIFNTSKRPAWLFFDWREGLDVNACMQACTIDALSNTYALAQELGKQDEVKEYPALIRRMKAAAKKEMYDKKSGLILSGGNKQVSVLSQAWMIRAGVLNQKEGQRALRAALSHPEVVMPGTPYGTHYLVEAMLLCGMNEEAKAYVEDYWGGMVKKGADTFWEAYDPQDDFLSPYHFAPLNSYCHAWSCTPIYFIHKYPELFQK